MSSYYNNAEYCVRVWLKVEISDISLKMSDITQFEDPEDTYGNRLKRMLKKSLNVFNTVINKEEVSES